MRPQIKLILKFITLGMAFIVLIKWLGIERRTFLESENICPNFGNLSNLLIPKKSMIIDPVDNSRKIGIKNRLGKGKFYRYELLVGAKLIHNQNEFKEYLSAYSEVCGGKPNFYNSIEYVKINRLKEIELKRQEIAKAKLETKEWGKLYARERLLKSDKIFLENRLSNLSSKLEQIMPISFKIVGKVAEKEKGSLVVFGSAIPDVSGKHNTSGFVHNGIIILKNSKKSDIVSPEYYEAKHVLAKDYYFVKRIDGRNTFGHYMPISVYDRKAVVHNLKFINNLKNEISAYKRKLLDTEKKLKDLEKVEENLIATAI